MDNPARKRARYSLQADIDVEVEGQAVQVHSQVLMSASEIFAKMLQSDTQEAATGRIVLRNKTLEGFKEVLEHLDLRGGAAPPAITLDNVDLLLQYADEFLMPGLLARCEACLVAKCREGQAAYALEMSDKYNLLGAKLAATRELARVHDGQLLGYEADATVRRAVYEELVQALKAAPWKLKMDEKAGSVSGDWKLILDALAEIKMLDRERDFNRAMRSDDELQAMKMLIKAFLLRFENRRMGKPD